MSRIKTLIFDFGDVFINLDKSGAMQNALDLFDMKAFEQDMIATNLKYEVGEISTQQFLDSYSTKFSHLSETNIKSAWNYIIKDFPKYRLEFIHSLAESKAYKLILLSNTNEMHIDYIKEHVPFYEEFKNCFDVFYLSHEIHLRKPDSEIYEFVLSENNLVAEKCLFVDDTEENTDAASELGINIWNIDETKEDIINLFDIKTELF